MLRILLLVQIERPLHVAAGQFKGGFDSLRCNASIRKIVAMKYGVFEYSNSLNSPDSPTRKTLPKWLQLLSIDVGDSLPRFSKIVSHIPPPYIAMPEIAEIFPRKSVQAPAGRKTNNVINAFFSRRFQEFVDHAGSGQLIFVIGTHGCFQCAVSPFASQARNRALARQSV